MYRTPRPACLCSPETTPNNKRVANPVTWPRSPGLQAGRAVPVAGLGRQRTGRALFNLIDSTSKAAKKH